MAAIFAPSREATSVDERIAVFQCSQVVSSLPARTSEEKGIACLKVELAMAACSIQTDDPGSFYEPG